MLINASKEKWTVVFNLLILKTCQSKKKNKINSSIRKKVLKTEVDLIIFSLRYNNFLFAMFSEISCQV